MAAICTASSHKNKDSPTHCVTQVADSICSLERASLYSDWSPPMLLQEEPVSTHTCDVLN